MGELRRICTGLKISGDFIQGHRPPKQISLLYETAATGQPERLTFRLDAFGDDAEFQRLCELNNCLDHGFGLLVSADVSGKGAIDLDDVQWQAPDV